MSLVMLKSTSNANFKCLEGRVGDLTIGADGRFDFAFEDLDGTVKHLSSTVQGRLGDLDDVRSKEVNINTARSTYDFAKLENYLEEAKLFDHSFREGIGEKIDAAEKAQASVSEKFTGIGKDDFQR